MQESLGKRQGFHGEQREDMAAARGVEYRLTESKESPEVGTRNGQLDACYQPLPLPL